MRKKYFTEEERKEGKRESNRKYKQHHKDKTDEYKQQHKAEIKQYMKQYYQLHKNKMLERQKQYGETPIGRAAKLLSGYKKQDKKYNRGECTLTPQWIVENIFSKPCHYCGETDWRKLGCDRIDNSKPHTEDNVVPCCKDCNIKKMHKEYDEFIKETQNRFI